jgi:hypothetical protein
MNYEDLRQRLLNRHPESRLTPLTQPAIEKLRDKHPNVPNDLIDFLSVVGWGRIGRMGLMIYSGPIKPENVYDEETAAKLKDVRLIGDDFSGYCVAYDTGNGWLLGEVNESGEFEACAHAKTLSDFVEERFLA